VSIVDEDDTIMPVMLPVLPRSFSFFDRLSCSPTTILSHIQAPVRLPSLVAKSVK
jgi:hypothetical protein